MSATSNNNDLVAHFTSSFSGYLDGLSKWNNLDELSEFIKKQDYFSTYMIKYLCWSVAIGILIDKVSDFTGFGAPNPVMSTFSIPLVGDLLLALIVYLGSTLSAGIAHFVVRKLGGTGRFVNSFVANLYVTATVYPFGILATNVILSLFATMPIFQLMLMVVVSLAQLVYLSTLLGKVHALPRGKLYLGILIATVVPFFSVSLVFGLVVGLIAAFASHSSRNSQHTIGLSTSCHAYSLQLGVNYVCQTAPQPVGMSCVCLNSYTVEFDHGVTR